MDRFSHSIVRFWDVLVRFQKVSRFQHLELFERVLFKVLISGAPVRCPDPLFLGGQSSFFISCSPVLLLPFLSSFLLFMLKNPQFSKIVKFFFFQIFLGWKNKKNTLAGKWTEISKHFIDKDLPCKNLLKIVEYIFSLPGSNPPVERVFSIMNNIWSTEKSQLSVED